MTANNNSLNRQALREFWHDIIQIPEYLNADSPDNGFFWFGPAGTRTPFHHDLTNNFMAQVIGRKRVRIFPAITLARMYNQLHCYTEVDGGEIDLERFPLLNDVPPLDCILHPGELLFLPIGCWHYVHGLDVSVTMSFINFRWKNDFSQHYHTYEDV
jgi:ribosomal protein L16 Arg81 hydroxylase